MPSTTSASDEGRGDPPAGFTSTYVSAPVTALAYLDDDVLLAAQGTDVKLFQLLNKTTRKREEEFCTCPEQQQEDEEKPGSDNGRQAGDKETQRAAADDASYGSFPWLLKCRLKLFDYQRIHFIVSSEGCQREGFDRERGNNNSRTTSTALKLDDLKSKNVGNDGDIYRQRPAAASASHARLVLAGGGKESCLLEYDPTAVSLKLLCQWVADDWLLSGAFVGVSVCCICFRLARSLPRATVTPRQQKV